MSLVKLQGKTNIQGKTIFELVPGYSVQDANAAAYITAVETADNSSLEDPVKQAIDEFVIGCKADGIWSAIKASCILAGAKTLNGALVPLVGTAPTNNNFVSGDYNRKTGLIGDGNTKYLNSNRKNNADPQNNKHVSVYISVLNTSLTGRLHMGAGVPDAGGTGLNIAGGTRINSATTYVPVSNPTNFRGATRSNSTTIVARSNSTTYSSAVTSQTPSSMNLAVFCNILSNGTPTVYSPSRLSFYSIGESLDLAKLDTRVTNLMTAINSAI